MADFNEKSKAAYNQIADHYDSSHDGRFTEEFKRLLVKMIPLRENSNILDVACGNGSLLAALNRRTLINGFGIDIADRMIKNAVARNPDMKFHVAGCESIPFKNETMDIVTVCAAYHHFPDVAAFAAEARRVLKPNGMLYIAEIYWPTVLRLILNPFVPLLKMGDVKIYSPEKITGNFKRARFEEVDVKKSGRIQIISMRRT
jgi:ubiquinone/menaquinone biosynthesis C-methylase UbiE